MGNRIESAAGPGKITRKNRRRHDLPPDVQKLIKGKVVDLSSAHQFYEKIWDAVRPRLEPVAVEQMGGQRYRLVGNFFEFFMDSLRNILEFPRVGRIDGAGADLIVTALYEAGINYGTTSKPPTHGSVALWPSQRPISEAWLSCGELRPIFTRQIVLEDVGSGHRLREPITPEYDFPRMCIRVRVNGDRASLPKITIELEGELACVLQKGMYYSRDPYDQRARRNEAKRIWDDVLGEIRILLGVGQSHEGRPNDLRPGEAAYLKYFCGMTWPQVADICCPQKHTHAKQCKENIRKAVANFFEGVKEHARSLPPVRD